MGWLSRVHSQLISIAVDNLLTPEAFFQACNFLTGHVDDGIENFKEPEDEEIQVDNYY